MSADIENMFHQIAVPEEQSTYLRFFWYQDNDPSMPLIEYMSRVHLMGLTSTPAIANLAVRYAVREVPPVDGDTWMKEDDIMDPYHKKAIRTPDNMERAAAKSHYVDDFLKSCETEKRARRYIRTTLERLWRYDLKLCKVHSNSDAIQKEFSPGIERPKEMSQTTADLSSPALAMGHSSLGRRWNIETDSFNIKTELKVGYPMTKRSLLRIIMAPYDPLGIAAPALLGCKLFQRLVFPPATDDPHDYPSLGWDDPLPSRLKDQWKEVINTCSKYKISRSNGRFILQDMELQENNSCSPSPMPLILQCVEWCIFAL